VSRQSITCAPHDTEIQNRNGIYYLGRLELSVTTLRDTINGVYYLGSVTTQSLSALLTNTTARHCASEIPVGDRSESRMRSLLTRSVSLLFKHNAHSMRRYRGTDAQLSYHVTLLTEESLDKVIVQIFPRSKKPFALHTFSHKRGQHVLDTQRVVSEKYRNFLRYFLDKHVHSKRTLWFAISALRGSMYRLHK